MISYTITACEPNKHFIDIEMAFQPEGKEKVVLQLPAWRPGRYELANYAQNIQRWKAYDGNGKELHGRKLTKDSWEVATAGTEQVVVRYNYYAYQLDAGASYYDEKQLYINPVNCLMYIPEKINLPCSIKLAGLPDNYQIASSLKFDQSREAMLRNFHFLADSPFIASGSLQHELYKVGEYTFHIWMQGHCRPQWDIIKNDFGRFSEAQVKMFGELPIQEYHFLFQLPDHAFYHGVEHLDSTVIALGPGYRIMNTDIYNEFLGISSHELFHSWNIKSIRPVEMYPYDYSRENYSNLGYVSEGVTTYYGDLVLLRSGVYDWQTFSADMGKSMLRHFHSYGRLYQTLAEASFDSWLDGYKPGVPDRKISFYIKGMLVAFMLDISMRRDSNNRLSLDDVMRELYFNFAKKDRGFSEEDYLGIINHLTGEDYRPFFEKYVWGLDPIEGPLNEAMQYIGCELVNTPARLLHEQRYGFRIKEEQGKYIITQVAPDSPAHAAGLSINDEIVAINGMQTEKNLDELVRYFGGDAIEISFFRSKYLQNTTLAPVSGQCFFPIYSIEKDEDLGHSGAANFKAWAHVAW